MTPLSSRLLCVVFLCACSAAIAQETAPPKFQIPADKKFLIVREENIGKEYLFSTEKLGIVLSILPANA